MRFVWARLSTRVRSRHCAGDVLLQASELKGQLDITGAHGSVGFRALIEGMPSGSFGALLRGIFRRIEVESIAPSSPAIQSIRGVLANWKRLTVLGVVSWLNRVHQLFIHWASIGRSIRGVNGTEVPV
jgi:hypothetical protein